MKTALIESTQIAALAQSFDTTQTLVVLPVIDLEMGKKAAALAASRGNAEGVVLVVLDSARLGLVHIHNQIFKHTTSAFYAYLAQDAFVGRDWLSLGLASIDQKGAGLLAFNDGKWQGQLASFGLVRREWASQLYEGSLFFEGYKSHYADTELTLIARDQGRYAYDPNAVAMEVDWNKDKASTHPDDQSLFRHRAKKGFGERVRSIELRGLFS